MQRVKLELLEQMDVLVPLDLLEETEGLELLEIVVLMALQEPLE